MQYYDKGGLCKIMMKKVEHNKGEMFENAPKFWKIPAARQFQNGSYQIDVLRDVEYKKTSNQRKTTYFFGPQNAITCEYNTIDSRTEVLKTAGFENEPKIK